MYSNYINMAECICTGQRRTLKHFPLTVTVSRKPYKLTTFQKKSSCNPQLNKMGAKNLLLWLPWLKYAVMHASMMRVMCRTDARQREQAVRRGRIGKPLPFLSSQVMTRAASASPVETPTPFSRARASLNRPQNAMCLCSKPVSAEEK